MYRSLLPILLVALLLAAPAAASSGRAVLGADGTLVELLDGTYAELFADGNEADGDAEVLALALTAADGTVHHTLVPGTDSGPAETSPTLVYDGAGLFYVLWEGRFNVVHPLLYLAAFDGNAWSEPVEITGNPLAHKGHPQLVVTHGDAEEGPSAVAHLVWWEESSLGSRKRWAPVLLGDSARGLLQMTPLASMQQRRALHVHEVRRIGADLRIRAFPLQREDGP